MTPTTLAETILRDVPTSIDGTGVWLDYDAVLAALTAAMDPAIAERAGEVLEGVTGTKWHEANDENDCVFNDDGLPVAFYVAPKDARFIAWCREGVPALLAQNAALRAERDDAVIKRAAWELEAKTQKARAEAAEAKVKRLRAERDDALTFLDNAVSKAPEPLKALGKYLAGRLDEDEWPTAEQHLNAAAKACADHTAAEAQIAALTARVEGLTGALESIANDVDLMATGRTSLLGKMGRTARAALSATEADNDRQA